MLRLRSGNDRTHVASARWLRVVLLVALLAGGSLARAEWSTTLEYQRFKWSEPSIGVTETGPILGLGLGWRGEQPSGWTFSYRAKYYFGTVDYDGSTLIGGQPVQGSVDYNGLSNEVELGAPLDAARRLRGVLGLGFDYWNRQLTQVQREEWSVYFLRAGAEWGNRLHDGWFLRGGVKYPFYVVEDPHARSIGFDQDVKLRPDGTVSFYAELGYRFHRDMAVSGFYDTYRFKESPVQRVSGPTCTASFGTPTCGLFQPASNATMLGLRLHLYF